MESSVFIVFWKIEGRPELTGTASSVYKTPGEHTII